MSGRGKRLTSEPVFWLATFGGAVMLTVVAWCLDLRWLHDEIAGYPATLVFLAIVVLPLAGVPVSLLYAVAGARFGSLGGLGAILAATALHLWLSWWIAHGWLKAPLEKLLNWRGLSRPRVPDGLEVPVSLLVALMPGASYALKNYLLVLGGVTFRPYFWTLLPAHVAHSSLALFIGDFAGAMTGERIAFLGLYALVLIGLSHVIYRRLGRRRRIAAALHDDPLPGGDGSHRTRGPR